jgi:hypothetical protein
MRNEKETPKSFTAEDMFDAYKAGHTEGYCRGWSEWPIDSVEQMGKDFFKWINRKALVDNLGKRINKKD